MGITLSSVHIVLTLWWFTNQSIFRWIIFFLWCRISLNFGLCNLSSLIWFGIEVVHVYLWFLKRSEVWIIGLSKYTATELILFLFKCVDSSLVFGFGQVGLCGPSSLGRSDISLRLSGLIIGRISLCCEAFIGVGQNTGLKLGGFSWLLITGRWSCYSCFRCSFGNIVGVTV